MTRITCERARDLIPDEPAGLSGAGSRQALEEHLAECAECRAEADVVRAVRRAVVPVPANLESRVLASAHGRATARWGTTGQLAMAATLAAAVLGGTLLFRGLEERSEPAAEASPGEAATVPLLEDPLLRGGSVLGQLTEAELQILLERLES